MCADKKVPLNNMKTGESGIVREILGGSGLFRRLQALGLRVGMQITKKSGAFLWGPVTAQVGGTQIGIGHGMAAKIIVEVKK
ncbi:MAG: FeoA family protein [Candidatus Margulisiibacteriota bacterium]|nr:FeoA family protein [Candidatus Margulisiibacteriota bacterium]